MGFRIIIYDDDMNEVFIKEIEDNFELDSVDARVELIDELCDAMIEVVDATADRKRGFNE